MNILVISSSRAYGGLENQTVNLLCALKGRGHNAVLGCPEGSLIYNDALKFSVPVEDICFTNAGDLLAAFRLATAVRRHKIEVLVATMGKEYWPAAVMAGLMGRKVVYIRHMADRLKKHTVWLVRTAVDGVIAVSGFVREGLLVAGVPAEKISVVHNGIGVERFADQTGKREETRRELGISPDDFVVGVAGALNEGKGMFVLMKAAERLKDFFAPEFRPRLLLIGDGPSRAELEEMAKKLGLAAIFTGRRLDMERMYSAMDVFLFPSICRESFGMVVIEAMASGLPVIASSVGGVPEIVKNGENGILVPPGDPSALAGAICRLAGDAEFSKQMARNGEKNVLDNFSREAMAIRFEEAIASFCGTVRNRRF